MVADRRLSLHGQIRGDNAVKLMKYQSADGWALIGYAGVGRSIGGMEPSQWMSNVLNGRLIPMEAALGLLAHAAREKILPHARVLGVAHTFVAACLVDGEPRLYTIELVPDPCTQVYSVGFTRYATHHQTLYGQRGAFFAVAGCGATHFKQSDLSAARSTFRAYDRGAITAQYASRALARLNLVVYERARSTGDVRVGKKCVVAFTLADGGGEYGYYDGIDPDADPTNPYLPTIMRQYDAAALARETLIAMQPAIDAFRRGEDIGSREPDEDALRRAAARVRSTPDDTFK